MPISEEKKEPSNGSLLLTAKTNVSPSPVHMEFLMSKVALGNVLLLVLWFSTVGSHSINAPYSFICLLEE